MRHSRAGDGRDGGALRILVIDADDLAVQLVRGIVAGMEQVELVGWTAEPAAGLRLVARARPELVLVELPEEEGPGLASAPRMSSWLPTGQTSSSSAPPRSLSQAPSSPPAASGA